MVVGGRVSIAIVWGDQTLPPTIVYYVKTVILDSNASRVLYSYFASRNDVSFTLLC